MKNEAFRLYLQNRGLQPTTIADHLRTLEKFQAYLKKKNIHPRSVEHKQAVKYVQHLQKTKHYTARTVNNKIGHLKSYYAYLNRSNNPFGSLHIRGEKSRLQVGLLTGEQLLNIFTDLPQTNTLEQRVKVLAGFYIFQGVTTTEMLKLTAAAFDWDKGTVEIPATIQSNLRVLPLHPSQLRVLLRLVEAKDFPTDQPLFQCLGEGKQSMQVVKHLHKSLKKTENYRSLRHLRYSVIMNWLKTDNLRMVQYKAGHRYISSTEKYLSNDISSLKNAVNLYHPLG